MPDLLLIGVGCMGRPYAAAARRLGVRVRAVEAGPGVRAVADLVDVVHLAPGDSDEALAAAAYAAVEAQRPDAVLAFSEQHVLAAALVQDTLGLPGPSLHAAVLSRNKALQRARFGALGLRQPGHLVVERLRDAAAWAAARGPVVVKPLSGTGSDGVELLADAAAFASAAERRGGEGPVLVEEAVEGPEYSWEALVRDGEVWFRNVTAKETTGPPEFVELAHRAPARLDRAAAAQVERLALGVLAGLRMRSGLVHLEFRLTAEGPTIMEVAVRTPGDFIMEVLGLAYDVDLFELTVRVALGLPLPEPPAGPVREAASCWLVAPPGVVTAVQGLDATAAHPNVHRVEAEVAPGDVVGPLRCWSERVASAVVAAGSREELEDTLAFVRRTLVVATRPGRAELAACASGVSASWPAALSG